MTNKTVTFNLEEMQNTLSSLMYAEHQGDVQRVLPTLARLLDLPQPIDDWDDWDSPYVWPWDVEDD